MEDYPEELRTPPVALTCLVGCPELHPLITAHLHSQQPPINAIALPDFSKISVIPLKKPPKDTSDPVSGILKRDWLSKHRTRIPAVVAAIFNSRDVSGDPAQWLQVCTDIENLKASIRGRNIKLVVLVVSQSGNKDETSEERILALRKRAEIDSKNLIIFVPDPQIELQQSLSRLWTIFVELAYTYYRDEGRRVRARLEKKNYTSMELNVRYCFKVAIYAEFRRDWLEALKLYEDAYHALREMVGASTRMPPIQRLVEIKAVAEQLHFKMSTLLLHGGKVLEAIAWFRQHTANYRKLVGAPEVIFLHWEWLSRQYLVFAQLLETSSPNALHVPSVASVPAEKPTEWEFNPAHYFQLAASYLKEKNTSLEFALSMDGGPVDGSAESVVASVYFGQYSRLLEHEDALIMQPLTDDEYTRYALAEGKRFQDSFEIIALLKRSFEAYSNSKADRTAAYCELQMAREYYLLSDFSNAKQIFDNIANLYRREGWLLSLWEVLGYLRECSKGMSSAKDFIEYSLEMAALPETTGALESLFKDCGPVGPATLSQREYIHKEAFEVARGESELNSDEQNGAFKAKVDYPLHLEIDLVSPLRATLLALVAFHQPMVKPGAPSLITISLRSQLPLNVEIDQLEVQFNQSECNFTITNGQKPQIGLLSNVQPGHRVETAPALVLATNKWLRLTYEIISDLSGKLECIYVIARIGENFTVCCRAESPASMNDSPLWKFENLLETIPIKDPGLALSGQKAIQVEEPDPQVDLILGSTGPALVGESFILPVTVASRGHAVHSGELKINLVDTRGGGLLSPREEEPFSSDNLHVELVDMYCDTLEDQCEAPCDTIQKIQPSFGLTSVPSLEVGDSWSCKLKIKWNRPKPIMLYVSLGYFPQSDEGSLQKVHVHKSLQIEGKTAVTISHLYLLPFRQDPLLLSKLKSVSEAEQMPSLALNEITMLIVSVKNCSEVPLRLLSMCIETEDKRDGCFVGAEQEELREGAVHMPGEEFRKVFTIFPKVNSERLKMGSVSLRWERDSRVGSGSQVTKHRLGDVNVELPLLVVSLECPPHAIIGNPFLCSVKIQNQTEMLQEMKCSISDSQSFVLSGPHSDTLLVLPRSVHVLTYMLVPLGLGSLQLPRVTVTAVRYSAGLQPSTASSVVFWISGSLLDESQVISIVEEIKLVITASSSRKKERAERAKAEDFDAEEGELLKEEDEQEEEVFDEIGEILGTLIKTFKGSFLPFFDQLSSYLMPMWGKDKTAEERRIAICIFDDVAEQCRESALKYYDTYLPFLLEACNDDNSDVRQAAVYGLGVCAEFGGSVFKPLVGEALSRLNVVIRHPNALQLDNVMAYDNAVSALGKICQYHRDNIDSAQVVPAWLNCLPIKGDVIEAKVVHDQLCSMVERSDLELLGPNNQYLPKIVSVFAEVLCGGKDLASEQTASRMLNLLRQLQQTLPPSTLASTWSSLQPQQQLALQTILSS